MGEGYMLYRSLRVLSRIVYKLVFRLEAIGVENVPAEGPVILCSNHISVMDPPTIGTPLNREIRFMAKQELFEIPLFGRFITKLGAFPVKRGGISKQSMRTALEILKSGQVLGIFPEGTRKNPGVGKRGAATFALRSKAVVIPVAIIGNYRLFRKMKIVYGEPVDLDDLAQDESPDRLEKATERIMERIHTLINEHRA